MADRQMRRLLVAGLLVALVGSTAVVACAQPPLPGEGGEPPMGPPGGPPGGPMPGGPPGMPGLGFLGPMLNQIASAMRVMAAPAMVIHEGKVYVAQGGTLFRFDADTLALEKQTTYIESPPMPMMPGMPPGPPRMGPPPAGPPLQAPPGPAL